MEGFLAKIQKHPVWTCVVMVGVLAGLDAAVVALLELKPVLVWGLVLFAILVMVVTSPAFLVRLAKTGVELAPAETVNEGRSLIRHFWAFMDPAVTYSPPGQIRELESRLNPPPADPRERMPEVNLQFITEWYWTISQSFEDHQGQVSVHRIRLFALKLIPLIRCMEQLHDRIACLMKRIPIQDRTKRLWKDYQDQYNLWLTAVEQFFERAGVRPASGRWTFARLPSVEEILGGMPIR